MPDTESWPSKRRGGQPSKGLKRNTKLPDFPMVVGEDLCLGLGNLLNLGRVKEDAPIRVEV